MKRSRLSWLMVLMALLYSSASTAALSVYSAAEHSTQLADYAALLEDSLVQLEKLGVAKDHQITAVNSFREQLREFDAKLRNLRRLERRFRYIQERDVLSVYHAARTAVEVLHIADPNNPNYEPMLDIIVRQEYGLADQQRQIALENLDEFSRQGLEEVNNDYELALTSYKNRVRITAARTQEANRRNVQIEGLADQLEELDDLSELETLQLTAWQQNMLMRQQEAMIEQTRESNIRASDDELVIQGQRVEALNHAIQRRKQIRNRDFDNTVLTPPTFE